MRFWIPVLTVLLLVPISGCGNETAAPPDEPAAGPDTPATVTPAEALDVLRTIYRPIQAFYDGMRSGDEHELPPAGLDTPQALRDTLRRTMAASIAESYAEQLLMERDGRYIVRPTERAILPFEGSGPALDSVTVEPQGGAYVITEYYAENALYGDYARANVVAQRDGAWFLTETRRADPSSQR